VNKKTHGKKLAVAANVLINIAGAVNFSSSKIKKFLAERQQKKLF